MIEINSYSMKKLIPALIGISAILSFSSCKKDETSPTGGQRPDLGTNGTYIVVDVRNNAESSTAFIEGISFNSSVALEGDFPLERRETSSVITPHTGVQTISVQVTGSGSRSITISDADGKLHCQDILTDGATTVSFNNIAMSTDTRTTVTYQSGPCDQ